MLTEKDYCDYETCVTLKELGYVGICDAYYELTGSEDYNRDSFEILYTRDFIHPDDIDRVAAPLLYQAQKWLREAHNLHIEIIYSPACWTCKIYNLKEWNYVKGFTFIHSYEEALSKGIKEAIKILSIC